MHDDFLSQGHTIFNILNLWIISDPGNYSFLLAITFFISLLLCTTLTTLTHNGMFQGSVLLLLLLSNYILSLIDLMQLHNKNKLWQLLFHIFRLFHISSAETSPLDLLTSRHLKSNISKTKCWNPASQNLLLKNSSHSQLMTKSILIQWETLKVILFSI